VFCKPTDFNKFIVFFQFLSIPFSGYIADLMSFWVDNQMYWIILDDWLYRMVIILLSKNKSQPASNKGLSVAGKLLHLEKIKEFAAMGQNLEMVFGIKNEKIKNQLLVILCESESIAQILDQRCEDDPCSLDSLIVSWMAEGQYDFSAEIDGRLRLSFTTTEVKCYDTEEIPRRSNIKKRLRPVYLPQNLAHNLAQHYFGANKLKLFVTELIRQLEQEISADADSIIDRRAALWSCGAILSSNIGVNLYSSLLVHLLLNNLNSLALSIRATAFYATNWMARSPYGADLIEMDTKMAWKVKKKFVGDGQNRQRNSTADSWSTFHWDRSEDLSIRKWFHLKYIFRN
jgi:hypothetical protein